MVMTGVFEEEENTRVICVSIDSIHLGYIHSTHFNLNCAKYRICGYP